MTITGIRQEIRQAIVSGVRQGVDAGYGSGPSLPNLLFDGDYREPAVVGIGGNGTYASPYATDEWFDFSTATAPNNVGTETLDNTGGLLNRSKNGNYDGATMAPLGGWESDDTVANASKLISSGATAGDSDSEDFSFRVVFQGIRGVWTSSDYMISKYTGGVGWYLFASGGRVSFTVRDGTSIVSLLADGAYDADTFNGTTREIKGRYDFSAQMLYLTTDLGETSISTAGLGPIANAAALQVNGLNGAASTNGISQLQIDYVGVSVGSGTGPESFYNELVVLPGAQPSAGTALATINRDCVLGIPVADGKTAAFAYDTLPIGWHSGLTNTNKLGLFTNGTYTNVCVWSEALSNWTQSGTSAAVDNSGDGPSGFRSASKITAGAANDTVYQTFVPAASSRFHVSVLIKEVTAGCTGRVFLYHDTGAAEVAATSFTASSIYQTIQVNHNANLVNGDTYSVRIEIDTNGEELLASEVMVNQARQNFMGRMPYLKTSGSAVASVAPVYESASDASNIPLGEWHVEFIAYAGFTLTQAVCGNGGGAANFRRVLAGSSGNIVGRIYDSLGATEDASLTMGTAIKDVESSLRFMWDESTGGDDTGGYEALGILDGVTHYGEASPWEGTVNGPGTDSIVLGGQYSGGSPSSVIIARLRSYDGVNGAIP